MSETLQQFIVRRRGELDADASRLKLELLAVESEREKVDKVAMMFASDPEEESEPHSQNALAQYMRPLVRSPRRVSETTIKEMVVDILLESGEPGLTALDILVEINKRVDVEYPRTSLSPQLSRLKAEGKVHREGRLWMLGDGPDVVNALDFREPPASGDQDVIVVEGLRLPDADDEADDPLA